MTTNKKRDQFIKFVKIAQLKNWHVNIHMGEKMDIEEAHDCLSMSVSL